MKNIFEKLNRDRNKQPVGYFSANNALKIVNKRIRMILVLIVILFSIIILQLFRIQIIDNDYYVQQLANSTFNLTSEATPRGQILDAKGNVIAATEEVYNFTYFPLETISEKDSNALALKFAKQFGVTSDMLSQDDKLVLYIRNSTNEAGENDYGSHLLSEEDLATLTSKAEVLSSSDYDTFKENLIKSKVTPEMLNTLSEEDMIQFFVKTKMEGSQLTKRIVLENVSRDQVSYLAEHKSDFPGFDVDTKAWSRSYPYDSTLRDVIGNVSSSVQGLPKEDKDVLMANGYALNDRVGTSGLEQQYNDLLFGQKSVSKVMYDTNGMPVFDEYISGKKGYDLHLTLDIEFQKRIDDLVVSYLEKESTNSGRTHLKEMYITMLNPNNGEIYAMSGAVKNDDDSFTPYASGNYLTVNSPGSVVKGATVYMGLNEGVIQPGEVINDAPLQFKGTIPMGSFKNYGNVDEITALQKSSNVYMWQIAIRLGGGTYVAGESLLVNNPKDTLQLMRNYYSSFGLGVLSGLDVPNEQTGYFGTVDQAFSTLHIATGQYDTYSNIQLATYASTIANGGYTITPHFVKNATEVNSDHVVFENSTTYTNGIYGNREYLERVQAGFEACATSVYCANISNSDFTVAAKTGTAEIGETGTNNSSLVGYAPAEEPTLSFACMSPNSVDTAEIQRTQNICLLIMPEALQIAKEFGYIK